MVKARGSRPPTRRSILFAPSGDRRFAHSAYVGLWKRTVAAVLDFLMVLLVFGLWLIVGVLGEGSLEFSDLVLDSSGLFITIWTIVTYLLLLGLGIGSLVLVATRGQTPGKMAMGLKVVNEMGEPPGFAAALLRVVGKAFLPYSILGFIAAAWDRENQALHDHLARTHVIRSR